MAITVQIPTALRRHTAGVSSVACAATNLGELFSVLDEKFPELKPHLRDEAGQVRRFLNIYVNEEDIRFLGNEKYAFQDGDEVLVIPSIAGGSWPHGRAAFGQEQERSGDFRASFIMRSYSVWA